MKALFVKRFDRLVPADDDAQDTLMKYRDGSQVMVDITQPRNPQQHRLYFALMGLIADNTQAFADRNHVRHYIQQKLGLGKWRANPDGSATFEPDSISYASMEQGKFQKLWEHTVDFVVAELLPGLERSDLEAEVWNMVGINYEEANA